MTSTTHLNSANTNSLSLRSIVDRNTLVWWGLILTSVLLAVFVTPWGGLFWLAMLAIDDLSLYVFGTAVLFDSQLRVRRNYQWIHNLYDNTTGSGRDLGFNLLADGEMSQVAKFRHMADELKLQPRMKVCDVGCGYGDWMRYCRDVLDCEVVGINLTPEQAHYARREYGLDVRITNWKRILTDDKLQRELYGRFDAVTFMDTVEHYVSMEDRRDLAKQEKIYSDMCLMASKLLRQDSTSRRVFISCLHQTHRQRNLRFYIHSYFMDKIYSGHYPFTDEGPLKLCERWFNVLKVEDKTEDYRLTGVRDSMHFQAIRIKMTPRKLGFIAVMMLLDPFVIHRLLYYGCNSWMFFYGENAFSNDYDPEYRRRVSWVLLYWITLEQKRQASDKPRLAEVGQRNASTLESGSGNTLNSGAF